MLNPPRESTNAPSNGPGAPRATPPVSPSVSATPRRSTNLSNGSDSPAPTPTPAPKRQSGTVALPQVPAQPHTTPLPARRPSGPQPLPNAATPLPKRNSGPIPLPNTPGLNTPTPAPKRQSGPQPLPTQNTQPKRSSGPVPMPFTPMQQAAMTPRRQSGPVQLPQQHTTPIPSRRQSGPQALPNAAPAMNHHYPDVYGKSAGPAPMSPLSPMAGTAKPLTPKRQSGPQPIERRKTPPVMPAATPAGMRQSGPQVIERRPTPTVLPAAQAPKRQSGPHALSAPLAVPAPGASGTRRSADVQTRGASVQPSAAYEYTPRWYSLHLRTIVLSVCVATALAYLNFRAPAIVRCQAMQKEVGESKVTSYVTEIRGRGWPLVQTQTVETSDPIVAMEKFQKDPPKPIGAKNILVCLGILLGLGALCEFLARRGDAAADAEAAAS